MEGLTPAVSRYWLILIIMHSIDKFAEVKPVISAVTRKSNKKKKAIFDRILKKEPFILVKYKMILQIFQFNYDSFDFLKKYIFKLGKSHNLQFLHKVISHLGRYTLLPFLDALNGKSNDLWRLRISYRTPFRLL